MTQLLSPWPDDDFDSYPHDSDGDDDDEPRVPITLTLPQQADLRSALDRALRADGCDSTLRIAQRWAEVARVPSWPRLRRELEGNGGYCDCEILFNVFPETDDLPPVEPL